MSQNKFFDTSNNPLKVNVYNFAAGGPPPVLPVVYSTLDGLPLGTDDNSQEGEIGLKVINIADRSGGVAALQQLIPGQGAIDITPSDSTIFDPLPRALWIGTGGDLSVTMADGSTGTFAGVPSGTLLPLSVSKVLAATTASDIEGIL